MLPSLFVRNKARQWLRRCWAANGGHMGWLKRMRIPQMRLGIVPGADTKYPQLRFRGECEDWIECHLLGLGYCASEATLSGQFYEKWWSDAGAATVFMMKTYMLNLFCISRAEKLIPKYCLIPACEIESVLLNSLSYRLSQFIEGRKCVIWND